MTIIFEIDSMRLYTLEMLFRKAQIFQVLIFGNSLHRREDHKNIAQNLHLDWSLSNVHNEIRLFFVPSGFLFLLL